LFAPIYLWKIQGWWTNGELAGNGQPETPFDPTMENPVFNPIDDAIRGVIAGAAITPFDDIELLARTDVVELLRQSLVKYRETVTSYTCTLAKQERINGKLNGPEVIECFYKEEPFSVMMNWKEGGDPQAIASLYVAGQHKGEILIRPRAKAAKFFGFVERAIDAADVKAMTRYLVTEFGLRCGTERTYKTWKGLREKVGYLRTEYLGLQKSVVEAGNRDCHVLRRLCDPPEEDGLTEITLYIDAETWFQVGSVLKAKDELIAYYWFRDIKLNPSFDPKQFTGDFLKKY